jgi:Asp-tRNA(Asn)/Glu-tRNA(Gln) amidotransferase B subunit
MTTKHEITSVDDRFEHGRTYRQDPATLEWEFVTSFSRYRVDCWFNGHPQEVLARLGITTERRRARELADFFDGNLAGFYYVAAACAPSTGDEALKWIMGSLAAHMNENKIGSDRISQVLPADYVAAFVTALVSGKIEKVFAKEVFAALITAPRDEVDGDLSAMPEWTVCRRRTGAEVVAEIIADPRFVAADASEIDAIIEAVITANPDNAAKVAAQPKLLNWFLGQVMKAAAGKAPAPIVTEKLKARFGV